MHNLMLRSLVLILFAWASVSPLAADEVRFTAADLSRRAVFHGLRLADDGKSLELDSGELIEDDGPAAGFSYQPNEERLSTTTWIKKELIVADPACRKATLLVGPGGGALHFLINGKPLEGT
jgi:hypothetical protein